METKAPNRKESSLRPRGSRVFLLALIIYAVSGLFFVYFYRYQLDPDGVSYISIAEKYAAGDFRQAVNGYWGPLLSWLLVPFLLVGIPSLVATKLLSLCIGLFTLIGLRSLCYKFEMSETIRRVVMFSLVIIVLQFAMWIFTPDLLLTCILLYYLNVIFRTDYAAKSFRGAVCGAIGAAAYLAKSYAFAFFLSHFLLLNGLHYFRNRGKAGKRNVVRNFVLGLGMFCILVAPWIYIISNNCGNLAIGMAGKYSWRVVGPESPGHPVHYVGFLEPPNETAVSGWEDPSYIRMAPWSPFQSWSYFVYELRHILRKIYAIVVACGSLSPLSPAIIFGYVLICWMPFNKVVLRGDALYPLVTILIYGAGYTFFLIEHRYIWLICLLLLPMGGHLLYRLFHYDFFSPTRRRVATIVLALSFVAVPLAQLLRDMNVGKWLYRLSGRLEELSNIRGNVASNDNWRESLCLAYHMNVKYYGVARPGISEEDLQSELKRNNIDYFFVWDKGGDDIRFLSDCEEVTRGKVRGLRVFCLKQRPPLSFLR